MKLLWFTNTPSLAKEKLKMSTFGGGWMESLQDKLQNNPNVELALSFYTTTPEEPFVFNNTHYFPLLRSQERGRFKRFLTRIKHKIEDDSTELKKYLNVIESYKPDIIHIFGTEFPYGLVSDRTSIPVIIWIQGSITVCSHKWYAGVPHETIKKNSPFLKKLKGFGLYHTFYRMEKIAIREQAIFKKCSYFMGRTHWDRRITKILSPSAKYFHCDEMLRAPFYNHIFEPHKSENCFNIVSVLNPDVYKGFEVIFQTMDLIKANYSKLMIKWRIIGVQGSEEIIRIAENSLSLQAASLNIEFLGKMECDALVSTLLQADLFIHPSHIENSPNAVCEAMILGMPVICSSVGGVSSVLENNKEGILVQDGDPYVLAGAIIEAIEDYSKMISFGIRARERACVRHHPDTIIENLIKIYQTLEK